MTRLLAFLAAVFRRRKLLAALPPFSRLVLAEMSRATPKQRGRGR